MKSLDRKIKRMKWFDVSLVKLSASAGIIFIFKLIPGGWAWVDGVSIWWFLVLLLIFMARPTYLWFKK